jgi:maltooligosyltrehalose trehalohydrolase
MQQLEQLIDQRQLGVTFAPDGEARVLVWAPLAETVAIRLRDGDLTIPLDNTVPGYWQTTTDQISAGDLYTFVLNNDRSLPDPVSMAQPQGVHGPSQVVDTSAFAWTDQHWQGPPLKDYLLYELHTGTFTPEGTFAGIESKLDYLVDLGITAIELMPVAQFPGERNWGYDGVSPFSVQYSYGGAAGLQRLVNACHAKGLAVVLDVVYNHIGPEGNYLPAYGPYFTSKYRTPWGDAINFDDDYSDSVRRYVVENVLMWFRDFHIDALRLDAVHAIRDESDKHILREIKEYVDVLMVETGKPHHLIVELDLNEPRYISPLENQGYGMDAQWNDEFHHALRVTAGGERHGYYADYDGINHLAKSYKDAYVYDGLYMPRRSCIVGSPTKGHPGHQFVVFSQNHDQIGNRMLGERPSQLVSFSMQKLMAGAVLSSPYLPMLFMGEEWSEPNPFMYFVSHSDPTLVEAVREGRKKEFSAFHTAVDAPDPQAERTFQGSKLNWGRLTEQPHQVMFHYYQTLLKLRKESALRHPDRESVAVIVDDVHQTLMLQRQHQEAGADGALLICLMNFAKIAQLMMVPDDGHTWSLLFDSADPKWLGPLAAPATLTSGANVLVQPESILIYTSSHV